MLTVNLILVFSVKLRVLFASEVSVCSLIVIHDRDTKNTEGGTEILISELAQRCMRNEKGRHENGGLLIDYPAKA